MKAKHSLLYIFTLLAFTCAYALPTFANDKIYSEIHPQSGTLEDIFNFSVVVQDARIDSTPKLDKSSDFEVVGTSTQSQTHFDGSGVKIKRKYSFSLAPKRTGLLRTPTTRVMTPNGQKNLKAINVSVTKVATQSKNTSSKLFIQQTLDEEAVYSGQQLRYSLELLSRIAVRDVELDTPRFDGFWSQDLGEAATASRNINGQRYDTIKLNMALFPLRSGEIELPGRVITARVQETRKSKYDTDPFFGGFGPMFDSIRWRKTRLLSNSLRLIVKDLPNLPPNADLWGYPQAVVGETRIQLEYDPSPIEFGKGKTVSVTVESLGNINPLKEVPLLVGDNIQVYKEAAEDKNQIEGNRLRLKRTFRFSLVPTRGNNVEIPPLRLTYFDPIEKRYRDALSSDISFKVTGAPESTDKTNTASNVNDALRYSEPSYFERILERISIGVVMFSIVGLGALIAILVAIRKLLDKQRLHQQRIDNIRSASNTSSLAQFYRDILCEHFGAQGATLGRDELKIKLSKKSFDDELQFLLLDIFDRLEQVNYSGQALESTALNQLKKDVEMLARSTQK